MRVLPLALLLVAACGPWIGVSDGDIDTDDPPPPPPPTTGDDEPTEGPAHVQWTLEPGGCGGLYGVVLLADGGLVAVGERAEDDSADPRPWVVRHAADGDTVWSRVYDELPETGAFSAVDRAAEDAVVAVGLVGEDDQVRPLLARIAVADGALVWSREGEPETGGLYGAAWSEGQASLWGVGTSAGDLLVARYDAEGALTTTFPSVQGGFSPAVGYAAALAGDDLVVCGRKPNDDEGARLWLGRLDVEGQAVWSMEGPDPGPGAVSDCWDVAVGPEEAVVAAESGYFGARATHFDAGGAAGWEYWEPNAGVQAVDIAADGTVWLAGWRRTVQPGDVLPVRRGWLRSITAEGLDVSHVEIDIDHVSPRDLKLHPEGGSVIVGQRLFPDACTAPWLARTEP
jgi:hypothetical protein